jgi:hypothetical protein
MKETRPEPAHELAEDSVSNVASLSFGRLTSTLNAGSDHLNKKKKSGTLEIELDKF